jgi:hypothetical protein
MKKSKKNPVTLPKNPKTSYGIPKIPTKYLMKAS